MAKLIPTAEMTLGPFFPQRYVDDGANDLTRLEGRAARGEAIEIHGRVTQEDGAPLDNLVLEIWQADANGVFRDPADPRHPAADPNFFGWGRAAMEDDLRTVFVLAEIEGQGKREIAEILGIPEGTAASRLRRALPCFSATASAFPKPRFLRT